MSILMERHNLKAKLQRNYFIVVHKNAYSRYCVEMSPRLTWSLVSFLVPARRRLRSLLVVWLMYYTFVVAFILICLLFVSFRRMMTSWRWCEPWSLGVWQRLGCFLARVLVITLLRYLSFLVWPMANKRAIQITNNWYYNSDKYVIVCIRDYACLWYYTCVDKIFVVNYISLLNFMLIYLLLWYFVIVMPYRRYYFNGFQPGLL